MLRGSATTIGTTAYFSNVEFLSYNLVNDKWSFVPDLPKFYSTLAVVNGKLTAIGGQLYGLGTDTLHSFDERRRTWVEDLPRMPTGRINTAVACTGRYLIVAGGHLNGLLGKSTNNVEIFDIITQTWHTACSLPLKGTIMNLVIAGDHLYQLGGYNDQPDRPFRTSHKCSLDDLLQSCQPAILKKEKSALEQLVSTSAQLVLKSQVWHKITDLPSYEGACISLQGKLINVGGWQTGRKPISDVYSYNPATDSWKVIGHLKQARWRCLVAALPNDRLMAMGGNNGPSVLSMTGSAEVASIV